MRAATARTRASLSAAMMLWLVTACGSEVPGAAPNDTTPPATLDRRAQITAMVEAAALKPSDLGVKKAQREETSVELTVPCDATGNGAGAASGDTLSASPAPTTAHYWAYNPGSKVDILSYSVYGYDADRGAAVVSAVGTALKTCTSWDWAGRFRMEVLGEFSVPKPSGVDGITTYCHHATITSGEGKGDKVYICDALVSRGSLVARVDTLKLTLSDARKELAKAVHLASAALVKAVPTA